MIECAKYKTTSTTYLYHARVGTVTRIQEKSSTSWCCLQILRFHLWRCELRVSRSVHNCLCFLTISIASLTYESLSKHFNLISASYVIVAFYLNWAALFFFQYFEARLFCAGNGGMYVIDLTEEYVAKALVSRLHTLCWSQYFFLSFLSRLNTMLAISREIFWFRGQIVLDSCCIRTELQ